MTDPYKEAAAAVWAQEALSGRMSKEMRRAMMLQEGIKSTEREQLNNGVFYDDDDVRLAVVHTRQDVVLMVSYLSSIAKLARSIRNWLAVIGCVAVATFAYYVALPYLKTVTVY